MMGLLPEFGEYEDSNQLVNEYIAWKEGVKRYSKGHII